ncbi:MAG: thiamine pyrophosphate-binding protein [Chloroflexota bacterium]|nr:thiamine pyrophosphate-binding protein [Chloroflexota bacterium]
MSSMTGGEAVVQSLFSQGVRAVFGLPGTHALGMFDALQDTPDIQRILTRHEQGATFMADGYARVSGDIGVCFLSTGPAASNSLAAMSTAFADSSPVLNISSQTLAAGNKDEGYLHDVSDQSNIFTEVTGWNERAFSVVSIPWLINDAFATMRSGRPKPAALEIPKKILDSSGEVAIPDRTITSVPEPTDSQISLVAKIISKSERPILWVGGGAKEATLQVAELAEKLGAPVLSSLSGKGVLPDNHSLSLGCFASLDDGVGEYLRKCDLAIVIGSHLGPGDTAGGSLTFPDTVLQIDLDPRVIGRSYPVKVGLVGDCQHTLDKLLKKVNVSERELSDISQQISMMKSSFRDNLVQRSQLAVELIDSVRKSVPLDGIVTGDVTIATSWANLLMEVYHPRTFLKPGSGALGAGLPLAMGAKVARPDLKVLSICGDGGFLYTAAELATAVQSGINVVALVVNDSQFGILVPQQMDKFGRKTMVDLHNPNFVELARNFGAYGVSVSRLDELSSAITSAFAENRPAVVEFRTSIPFPYDLDV